MFDVDYKINTELYEKIVSQIPENFSKIEKAIFIYEKLCLTLQYSIGYYIEEHLLVTENHMFKNFFQKASNLKFVDGDVVDEVVCFTFNAIFLYFLANQGLIEKKYYTINYPLSSDKKTFATAHKPLKLYIDDIPLEIDATYGILDNNDLILCKYDLQKLKGWKTFSSDDEKCILKAIEKCRTYINEKENKSVAGFVEEKDAQYTNLTFEQKVKKFCKLAENIPDYSIQSFNFLLKCKQKVFLKEEAVSIVDGCYQTTPDTKVFLQFGVKKVKDDNIAEAFLFVNPIEKIQTDKEFFKNLIVFEIGVKKRFVNKLSYEEFVERQIDNTSAKQGKDLKVSVNRGLLSYLLNTRAMVEKKTTFRKGLLKEME